MSILDLKGRELEEWLECERKKTEEYLEKYYEKEKKIEDMIKKIQHMPVKKYILIKNNKNQLYVQGELNEKVLDILLNEGYRAKPVENIKIVL